MEHWPFPHRLRESLPRLGASCRRLDRTDEVLSIQLLGGEGSEAARGLGVVEGTQPPRLHGGERFEAARGPDFLAVTLAQLLHGGERPKAARGADFFNQTPPLRLHGGERRGGGGATGEP